MEDCTYDETAERSIPLAVNLARLVSRRGALIVNRHRCPHARETAAALAPYFATIRLRRVRREADNILVCSTSPRGQPGAPCGDPFRHSRRTLGDRAILMTA